MATLSALKKSRASFMQNLHKEIEKIDTPSESKSYVDDRFWKPEIDKSGNGFAVIRFLPPVDGEDVPWARVFNHGFQGPTGLWYIENSLTTLNKKDPVSEYNTELWNSGNDADKDTARKQKRVLKYYSNIYVVSDPKHPENEGKVFLFRFGKKIFDKLTEAMNPAFDDEIALNPFDLWKGADFKLKIRKVDGFWNYDKSEFAVTKALFEDDDKLKGVYEKEHSLEAFNNEDQFKSYDELKEKLHRILTGSGVGKSTVADLADRRTAASVGTAPGGTQPVETVAVADEGDETLSYFAKLAEED